MPTGGRRAVNGPSLPARSHPPPSPALSTSLADSMAAVGSIQDDGGSSGDGVVGGGRASNAYGGVAGALSAARTRIVVAATFFVRCRHCHRRRRPPVGWWSHPLELWPFHELSSPLELSPLSLCPFLLLGFRDYARIPDLELRVGAGPPLARIRVLGFVGDYAQMAL